MEFIPWSALRAVWKADDRSHLGAAVSSPERRRQALAHELASEFPSGLVLEVVVDDPGIGRALLAGDLADHLPGPRTAV